MSNNLHPIFQYAYRARHSIETALLKVQNDLLLNMDRGHVTLLVLVTKNRCVTHVKIRGYANLVSSLLAYLISAVASWFSNPF